MFENNLKLSDDELFIARQIMKEITARLGFMSNVGLNYLELSRAANTLSGGEAQRIRLATQIGSGLQGVLYVLDEPSIGLHQRDNDRLIGTLKRLRDLGNTVLVVEHDEDTIREADYLLDIGPGAGIAGGQVVAAGTPAEVAENKDSITGGEAQRIKLATELSRRATGKTLYILDEPTTGLHSADVKRLLGILQKLVEGGNSMVIIEHNLDVIKSADHVIDMGPEGGSGGGTVVAEGTPEEIVKVKESFTGRYLKPLL